MSLLSSFVPFASGGGINSIQTGYINSGSGVNGGAGQDNVYFDITISSVTTSKSVPDFFGSLSNGSLPGYSNNSEAFYILMPRLTSATNLRLSMNAGYTYYTATGRWYVVEAK
jgi:hypothetical protein